MGARYCQNCKSYLTGDGETCSAFCRDRLALRRTADRQRAMSTGELMSALGDRLKPMSIDQLRSAEAAMMAEPTGAMFSGAEVQEYFGTDIPIAPREVQGDPLPLDDEEVAGRGWGWPAVCSTVFTIICIVGLCWWAFG